MRFSYKRLVPAALIILGIILAIIGWEVNVKSGVKGGELNVWIFLARTFASVGWSYIIVDGIVSFFEKRRARS